MVEYIKWLFNKKKIEEEMIADKEIIQILLELIDNEMMEKRFNNGN